MPFFIYQNVPLNKKKKIKIKKLEKSTEKKKKKAQAQTHTSLTWHTRALETKPMPTMPF
jgi:hypothetical protein